MVVADEYVLNENHVYRHDTSFTFDKNAYLQEILFTKIMPKSSFCFIYPRLNVMKMKSSHPVICLSIVELRMFNN